MQHKFYDVKARKAVTAEVQKKLTYKNRKTGRTSYAFRGETSDGRPLTSFVSQETYEKADI